MEHFGKFLHYALAPLATVILGISALVIFWLVPAVEEARLTASRLALERANAVRAQLVHSFDQSAAELNGLATIIALPEIDAQQMLASTLARNPFFVSIALVDPDGLERMRLTVEGQEEHAIGPRTHFMDAYFRSALSKEGSFGEVKYSASGEPLVPVIEPVISKDDTVTGVLVGDMALAGILNGGSLRFGEGSVFITDSKGTIIAHPDADIVRERRSMLYIPGIAKVVMGNEATDGLSDEDGYSSDEDISMFLVGVPAREGWGVFVEEARTTAMAAERKIILLSLAFCSLGLLFFWFMYRRQHELEKINQRFNLLLSENQQSGKLLIKKDRELNESNSALERTNADLSQTAHILIRRDLELSEANSRLEELGTVKSEFVSIAAHQLRTPLTGVRWSLKALTSGEYGQLPPEQQKVADDALAAIVGAIDLINDMLNVARVEGGRFNFSFVNQPVEPIIHHILEKAKNDAESKGVVLTADQISTTVYAFCDAEKMTIAIQNLVDNAIKYTPEHGTVTVAHSITNNTLTLTIKDSGIGIPKAEQHRLFTKFFRAPNAVLKQTSGTGLGLYLVKNIIERHKGAITLESEEGKGTTTTLTLPISIVNEPQQNA